MLIHVRFKGVSCDTLCSQYYSVEWLKAAYARPINPVPKLASWNVSAEVRSMVVLPPKGKRQAGRPKEVRIPSAGEDPRRKKCGRCGQRGHNRLRCPNPPTSIIEGTSAEVDADVGTSSNATENEPRSRRCRLCHETGHNQRRCVLRFPTPDPQMATDGNDE